MHQWVEVNFLVCRVCTKRRRVSLRVSPTLTSLLRVRVFIPSESGSLSPVRVRHDSLQAPLGSSGSDLLDPLRVRVSGCGWPRQHHRGSRTRIGTRRDHVRLENQHRDQLEPDRRAAAHGRRPGRVHDPEGPVRPDRSHHDRSPVLPDPSRQAEETGSEEEEIRFAVELRRLGGDGRRRQRRGRHAVRSSQPPQMSRLPRLQPPDESDVRGHQLILIINRSERTDQ